jgi:uroporphyrinogen decarboxylase
MTPRERIQATLNRQPVDRPPVDLWCTGEVLATLRAHTGEQEELAVYRALGLDKIVWVFPGYGRDRFDPNEGNGRTMWGVPTRMIQAGLASYQEFGAPPLGDCTDPAQLADYPLWPDPQKFAYAEAKALADRATAAGFATIGPWISHFEIYCQMRGLENALMDVVAEPDFMAAALDRIEAIQTAMLERMLTTLGDRLDLVFVSDDMGTQESLLLSLPAWDRHFRDRLRRWCDLIHRHGKKVFFHTDGAASLLVPRLIECGIDVFNPIQHVCPGMDRAVLKRDFGDRVIFHGGVDNQRVLPFGSTADVARETRECLATLGSGGGYICCSCHNAQAGTPVENILAMIATVQGKR